MRSCRLEIFDDGSGKVSKGLPLFLNQFGDTLPMAQADHRDEGEGRMTYTLYMTAVDSELAVAQASPTAGSLSVDLLRATQPAPVFIGELARR